MDKTCENCYYLTEFEERLYCQSFMNAINIQRKRTPAGNAVAVLWESPEVELTHSCQHFRYGITAEDVLEAIGKHRVRQVSIESELYFARKAQKHPTEIGIPAPDRVRLQELLKQLEVDGRIKSYGIGSGGADKVYEVIDGDDFTA